MSHYTKDKRCTPQEDELAFTAFLAGCEPPDFGEIHIKKFKKEAQGQVAFVLETLCKAGMNTPAVHLMTITTNLERNMFNPSDATLLLDVLEQIIPVIQYHQSLITPIKSLLFNFVSMVTWWSQGEEFKPRLLEVVKKFDAVEIALNAAFVKLP